ncbi:MULTISPECIES: hypothetical protein [unclassified Leclercia]|uniref:Uncharacterized protein n=1 Tax=Leclercia barmai TaxID=2785629 RepID=A0ABS7RZ49_9ENTR|nr:MULTISPECIES: hypothetical protein [unclassified Leclercia]MBZ0059594.1 hypothetical protein [Leclercia sp. EMC7]MCM5697274.1 hypothetical protein [Leclercia sp. LTM01]MCM5702131.1 hypothetical protein [Leclercia sp. LTM14]
MMRHASKPMKLVFSVNLVDPDHENNLMPMKTRALVQVSVTGTIADHGVIFTDMDAAHAQETPPKMFEIIENLFPMIGDIMQGVRSGKLKPDTQSVNIYDSDVSETIKPHKLDS